MASTIGNIEGYEIPLHVSLTQPVLLSGVPRSFMIMNATAAAAITLGLHVWWIGIPLGVVAHGIAYYMTRRDPYFFEALRRHIKHPSYLES